MSRLLKRVPMDFNHPLGKAWPGYINPHYKQCEVCGGDGYSPAGREAKEVFRNVAFHRWQNPEGWKLATVLFGREPSILGFATTEAHKLMHELAVDAGLPEDWSTCVCGGDGVDLSVKEAHDAWTEVEPPKGEGFQLWENVTKGSPVSPVFATFDELCVWCEDNATTFADHKATAEEWQDMLERDFVHHREGNMIFI